MTVIDCDFLEARVVAVKSQILAYDAAILALGTSGVQSYRLMTGQTDQMVTKVNLASLKDTLSQLLEQLQALSARIDGGTVNVRPAW